eukprot:Clim_evm15s153 gene=Clim_evmTU15s153
MNELGTAYDELIRTREYITEKKFLPEENSDDGLDDIPVVYSREFSTIFEAAETGKDVLLRANLKTLSFTFRTTLRDMDGYTPMHRAAYNGHTKCIGALLEAGCDPESTTPAGWTPLHSAARWEQPWAVRQLISAGVDANLATEGGNTALHIAAEHGCKLVIECLLSDPLVRIHLRNARNERPGDIARRVGQDCFNLFETAEVLDDLEGHIEDYRGK